MNAQQFLKQLEHDSIVQAIRDAEQKTSGEIRVFISSRNPRDPMATARRRFLKLGMDRTKERNAVLIYVAPRSRKFAIMGDKGIHARCGDTFWQELTREMTGHFTKENYTDGILHVIRRAGELLADTSPLSPATRTNSPTK